MRNLAGSCYPLRAIYLLDFAKNTIKTAIYCEDFLKILIMTLFGDDKIDSIFQMMEELPDLAKIKEIQEQRRGRYDILRRIYIFFAVIRHRISFHSNNLAFIYNIYNSYNITKKSENNWNHADERKGCNRGIVSGGAR